MAVAKLLFARSGGIGRRGQSSAVEDSCVFFLERATRQSSTALSTSPLPNLSVKVEVGVLQFRPAGDVPAACNSTTSFLLVELFHSLELNDPCRAATFALAASQRHFVVADAAILQRLRA